MPANGRTLRRSGGAGDLPRAAGRQHAGAHVVPVARRPVRVPRHAQRVAVDPRLLHAFAATTGRVEFRPTCHYAYHPCNDAVLSFHELFGAACRMPDAISTCSTSTRSSTAATSSACCCTATPATPTGSARSSRSRRPAQLAPHQNATGLQVTSAVLAGVVWALENPEAGIVETDDMDHVRCLEMQTPYLGNGRRLLHRLDPAHRSPRPVRRGHRPRRPVAVPQRARPLNAIGRR